ncbi:MAG: EamA family transporter, partial [Candidatus Micrarchaeota archaeon]|nr:EamA family transporter [Candidatus Micrarchaeota archaeon]
MLEWVLVAVLAQMSFALGALIDKIVRGRYFGDSTSMTVMLLIAQALPAVLLLFANIGGIAMAEILLALFAGIITAVPLWLYSESIKNDEISSVAPLWQTIPVFVLVFAYLLLGERLPPLFYLSFAFMLVGGLLVSAR